MAAKTLTELGVAKLKAPPGKQIAHHDKKVPGLILVVSYGGTKTWRVVRYINRKPKTYKLAEGAAGRFPFMTVDAARKAAIKFLADPDAALRKTQTDTFKDVAERWVKRYVKHHKLRSANEIERCLNRYVYPKWESRIFTSLRKGDVTELLNDIVDNNGARQADYVLAIVRGIVNWYNANYADDDYVVPVVKKMARTKPKERQRKRILNDDEIRAVWKRVHGTYGALVKVALLSAQREGKVVAMKRTDLDADGVWTIPAEDREKATAGSLKLPQAARDIIEKQPRIDGNPFVFPADHGKGHFNSFSQRKAELDAKLKQDIPAMPPWVFHDLRRTARSLMSRAGVRPDIAERVLGHAIPGVEGVYDRHAYSEEKAEALKLLAGLIDTIINPPKGNVVAIVTRRKRR